MRSTQNTYPISLGIRITGVDDATFGQTGGLHSPTTPHECADPYIALNPYQRPILPLRSRRWSRTRRSPCRRMTLRSHTRRLTTIQPHHTTPDCPCSFAHTQLVPLAVCAQVPVCDAPLQPHPTAPCTRPCTNRVPLSSQRGYTADNLSGAPFESIQLPCCTTASCPWLTAVLRFTCAQRRASTRRAWSCIVIPNSNHATDHALSSGRSPPGASALSPPTTPSSGTSALLELSYMSTCSLCPSLVCLGQSYFGACCHFL